MQQISEGVKMFGTETSLAVFWPNGPHGVPVSLMKCPLEVHSAGKLNDTADKMTAQCRRRSGLSARIDRTRT